MTLDQVVDDIFLKEGDRYSGPPQNDQPTGRGGITLAALQTYYNAIEPPRRATVSDLIGLTHNQARTVVQWTLTRLMSDLGLDQVWFGPLRLQLLDFAYNSGGPLAMRWLQRVLNVPRTGRLDDDTRRALKVADLRLVNQALIAARLEMIDRATNSGTVDKKFEEGLESRALKFSLLEVP